MILTKLCLAAGLLLTSGVAPTPFSVKDMPPRRPAVSTVLPSSLPPLPGRSLSYVLIENGGNIRLPMSREEMDRYGYVTGQIIPLRDAARIVEEKLKLQGH